MTLEPHRPRSPRFALVHGIAAGVDPEGYLRWRHRRDGDPFWLALPGMEPMLLTGTVDGAQEIFQSAPERFEPPQPNPIEPLLGGGSLVLLRGERHQRERRVLMPPFQGDRMRAYGPVIQEATLAELSGWTPGQTIDALRTTQAITLQVIIRAIFGVDDAGRRAVYATTIGALLEAYTTPLLLFPMLRRSLLGRGPWVRFRRLRAAFDALLREDVARQRSASTSGREDMLSLLLAIRYEGGAPLADDDLLDELRTLLVAGHETTATALAWALFHVHRSPDVRQRLLAELAPLGRTPAPAQLAALPYLSAVCQEALRLHPVVPLILRRLRAPMALRGVDVSAGQTVGIAVPLLHGDPQVWPEPAQFRPQRFLDRKYSPFEYAPFGGGNRRCIGAAFAHHEMTIVLGTIMARASLAMSERQMRQPPPKVVPRNVTTGPRSALRLTCTVLHPVAD